MPKTIEAVPYRDSLLKALGNPADAAHYLNASLEDEDPRVFLMALRDVAEAHGGIGAPAESSQLNRENLYRALPASGNPSLNSLASLLNSLGLRLAVQSITPAGRRKPRVA
jgi:probable addiction module antidote protein